MEAIAVVLLIALIILVIVVWAEFTSRADKKAVDRKRNLSKKREEDRKKNWSDIEKYGGELAKIVRTAFLVKSCTRCYESEMYLTSVSPNARSIEYRCTNCGRKMHAVASSQDAQNAKSLEDSFKRSIGTFEALYAKPGGTIRLDFSVPEAPLPYEQTTREPVTESMRAEVWRRDNGQCVRCGSKQNLEFDHIIPVSKGGATTVRNLQLLCKSCNLSKAAKI